MLLVDDHELIRQGLAAPSSAPPTSPSSARPVRRRRRGARQRAPARRGGHRRPAARRHRPRPGPQAARATTPDVGIVVLTMYAGDEQLFGALEAGASAFVSKDAPSDDVVAAARHASVSPRSFTAADLADAMRRRMSPTGPQLSPRESEVLAPARRGPGRRRRSPGSCSSRESTAKTHISKIYEKLGAANRAQAIMIAIRAGLLAGRRARPEATDHALD